jgi:hypothetical protein
MQFCEFTVPCSLQTAFITIGTKLMRIAAILGACAVLLTACTGASTCDPGFIPTGGAAGRMGPGYCYSVPSNPNDRLQWDRLCNTRR